MSKIKITVEEWDNMTIDEQEKYLLDNHIQACYSTGIHDGLTKGFGKLDNNGFFEYQCKEVVKKEE